MLGVHNENLYEQNNRKNTMYDIIWKPLQMLSKVRHYYYLPGCL